MPQVLADPTSFDVAVTTYEMVTSAHFGAALSHTITWRLLVLDEGHKIKNEETRVANAMRHVACALVLHAGRWTSAATVPTLPVLWPCKPHSQVVPICYSCSSNR